MRDESDAGGQIAALLLPWFDAHGRKDLPWQLNRDAAGYRVWLSEVMLQQTQVTTVIPYFERFVERFAGFSELAAAPLDEVLSLWAGLGYYARARNLHACAQQVVDEFDARLPSDLTQLMQLPGIGRSTAGAIMSLAFGQHAPILDGNVKRVLSRVYCVAGWAGQSAVQKQLWSITETQTPEQRCADYNQAMMDLGATLCTRSKPDCQRCPLTSICQSYARGEQANFPQPKPKKQRPIKHTWMLIHQTGTQVLLEKRPPTGIWGGLWSLPELSDPDELALWQQQHLGQCIGDKQHKANCLRHQFSHYELQISTLRVEVPGEYSKSPSVRESDQYMWIETTRLNEFGIPAPVLKLLTSLDYQ